MSKHLDRRSFLKASAAASAGTAMSFDHEERILLAKTEEEPNPAASTPSPGDMPMGKIGDIEIGRLVCGGNLISGFAHSRDLIYVSPLLKHYFTDDKVMETLQLSEANGVNTAILRFDDHTLRILNTYWHERGGNMQWIAQVKLKRNDLTTEIDKAIDNGAAGVYIHGGIGDAFIRRGDVDLLGKALEHIRANGVIAGVGAHALEVPVACEKAGLEPDFYMKTLNAKNYWSAGPKKRNDSVWAETPEETIAFMKDIARPWIAFKTLGAGAIHPKKGFKYAFDNGADFICVGMFDFQVKEDAAIAKDVLAQTSDRQRPWRG